MRWLGPAERWTPRPGAASRARRRGGPRGRGPARETAGVPAKPSDAADVGIAAAIAAAGTRAAVEARRLLAGVAVDRGTEVHAAAARAGRLAGVLPAVGVAGAAVGDAAAALVVAGAGGDVEPAHRAPGPLRRAGVERLHGELVEVEGELLH